MKDSIKTVTEQIYQVIRSDILQQRRMPGEKLTTKSLQEQLGVSSTPIREALTHLQQDGLINYQPNIGMSVIVLTEHDLTEIFTLVAEFDAIAIRLAFKSEKCDDFLCRLSVLLDAAAEKLEQHASLDWTILSDDFHRAFYEFASNSRLRTAVERVRLHMGIFSNIYQSEIENQLDIQSRHSEMLTHLKNGDITAAQDTLRQHYDAYLQKAKRIIADQQNH